MNKEFSRLYYLDAFVRLYNIQGLTDFQTEITSKDIDFKKVETEVPKLLKHYKKSEIGKLMLRYPKVSLIYLSQLFGNLLYDFEIDVDVEHSSQDSIPITDMSIFTEEEPYFLGNDSTATLSFETNGKTVTFKYKYKLIDDKNFQKIKWFVISCNFAFDSNNGLTYRVGSTQFSNVVSKMSPYYKDSPIVDIKELMI